jgi:hypothetical protein
MAENKKIISRPAPYVRKEKSGIHGAGPCYIGVIKNNLDPTRAGRLSVYIAEYGGPDENDPNNWITVSYGSPFRGQTRQRADLTDYVDLNADITKDSDTYQENSFQSYGFWFVPPDLNGRVLCVFANNDMSQGYWIACIADSMDSHMTPAIGAVDAASDSPNSGGYIWNPSNISTHAMLKQYIEISENGQTEIPARLPVSEPVVKNQSISNATTPTEVKMYPQIYQTRQLGIQGLAFDFIRGTTSASSVRENPSQVFGVSTPGRLTNFATVKNSEAVIAKINQLLNSENPDPSLQESLTTILSSSYRTGGHQFIMDDGNIAGYDQGIKIRTTAGNQILLDDTNGQIYLINSSGSAWIELSPSGYIDIYSAQDFSVHTEGNFNIRADKDINIDAGKNLNLHSDKDIKLDAAEKLSVHSMQGLTLYDKASVSIGSMGTFSLSSQTFNAINTNFWNVGGTINLNTVGGPSVTDPGKLKTNKQIKIDKQAGSQAWWKSGTYNSICNRSPEHEPWPNHEVNGIQTSLPLNAGSSVIVRPQSGTTMSGIGGTKVGQSTINEAAIAVQPVTGQLCGLTVNQTRAFLAALAHMESSWPKNTPGKGGTTEWEISNHGHGYYAVNKLGYTGKYQFGAPALETYKFLRPGSSKNTSTELAINNPANWSGLMDCHNAVDFMNNTEAQEALIMLMMKANCAQLTKWGILTQHSTPEEIAGYLAVSHLLGTGGAKTYYQLTNPNSSLNNAPSKMYKTSDANGTNASQYYQLGSNAIALSDSIQNT